MQRWFVTCSVVKTKFVKGNASKSIRGTYSKFKVAYKGSMGGKERGEQEWQAM